MAKIVSVFVFIAVLRSSAAQWDNEWDKELYKVCPNNEYVSFIHSKHNNRKEDRLFGIQCRPRPSGSYRSNCYWTGWVNDYDQPFVFQCYSNGFIHGMRSIHNNKKEDRRWQFYCCDTTGYRTTSNCYHTPRNEWDAYFAVTVPVGSVMKGVSGVHNNRKEDRQYQFQICELQRNNPVS